MSLLAFAVVLGAYYLKPGLIGRLGAAATVPLHTVVEALDSSPLPLTAGRVLVVANETVGADELLGELRRLKNEMTAQYFVCVPAHPLHTGQGAAWSPDASVIAAQHRLDEALAILRGEGLKAEGALGDYRPLHALDDAVKSSDRT